MTNRLAAETSPYLRQHMHNPVDWYPWGEEALARARSEDRPLLVSIGYSACHWCHVMERESFEDPEIAQVMNANFVCVKVDREERPDVDAACMEACQALTGQGGWPLNAFLTPDRKPFFAGTYYPPEPRHGMPDWRTVLEAVAAAWSGRRAELEDQGARLTQALQSATRLPAPAEGELRPVVLDEAVTIIVGSFDADHGGFGRAPKFPMASVIEFLLARGQPEMALASLRAMATGGIYDQVGGGFARYAVDRTWTVPHFEKMLYDNALLARAYLHGFQLTGEPLLRRVCTETLDWALREMRSPEGGFYCALDADSEGVEGKFYVWTETELREVLGDRYEEAVAYFAPHPFEHGTLILEARGPEPAHRDEIRGRLLEARSRRVRPGLDVKVLCSWNALMVSALADAGGALDRPDYVRAAVACAELLVRDGVDHLHRTGSIPAFLDDHAYLLEALLTLYEATFEPRFYAEAVALADVMLERFADPEAGGFFTTVESDFPRRKDLEDSPIPAGGSSAAFGLLRLARLSGEARYERAAIGALAPVAPLAARHGLAFGHALRAIDFLLADDAREVAIVGPESDPLARVVREGFHPHLVLAGGSDGVPLLEGRGPVDGRAAAYVCQRFTCQVPVTSPQELAASL